MNLAYGPNSPRVSCISAEGGGGGGVSSSYGSQK